MRFPYVQIKVKVDEKMQAVISTILSWEPKWTDLGKSQAHGQKETF